MGFKKLATLTILGIASYVGLANKHIVKGVFMLEKPQSDLFTSVNSGKEILYLCKNNAHSEEIFKDWISHNGWQKADQVGEGYFFINDKEDTLLLNREMILFDRYLLWRSSRLIEN